MKSLIALLVAGTALVCPPPAVQKADPPTASNQQQPAESLFQKVFPKPTGRNGYEEFLRAADLAQTNLFRMFAEYYARLEQEASGADLQGDDGKVLPRPPIPPNVRPDDTLLEVGRKWSAAFSAIPELIHVGCQKSPHDPRTDFNALTVFPELWQFRSIARFLRVVMYVHTSDGAPAKATTVLSDGLRFGDSISGPTVIHTLVGFAVQGIMLAQASETLSVLSERDCRTLVSVVEELLARPNAAARSVAGERRFLTNTLTETFKPGQAKPLQGLLGDEEIPLFAQNLSSSQMLELKVKLTGRIERTYSAVAAALSKPESEWFKGEDLEQALSDPPDVLADVKTLDDFADYLEGMLTPMFSQLQVTAARYRTQLRLLGLHSKIFAFRWHWKRLPVRLAEAVPQDQLVDPFSGQEFQYSTSASGFRLFSRGFKNTGEIELKYTRPASAGRDPADPPGFAAGSIEPGAQRFFLRS
ncbi:MAG: hypothetical protein HZC36_14520 [Armatimonadetes bacterium]|nr:hypothetical protein [Armatimonadota bacterium]